MDVPQGKEKTILTDYVMRSSPRAMPHAVGRVARSVDRHVLPFTEHPLRATKGCTMTSQSY